MVEQGLVLDVEGGTAGAGSEWVDSGGGHARWLRRPSSPGLIGRERELELLARTASAPPALISVEGEAGVGKSRLVREALRASGAAGRHLLLGHCHRLREPFFLGPVIEALRGAGHAPPGRPLSPVVGAAQPLLPELAHLLPEAPAPLGDPGADRHRVFRALRELLGAFGPTVCVLEDLHWADEATLELLAFLVSEPPEDLVLVLTYRGEELPRSSPLLRLASRLSSEALTGAIELAPLGVEEVRRLVGAILETEAVSDEAAEYLHEQTAGIPFALEEVIRLLRERGQLGLIERERGPRELHRIGVPPAIGQAIRERMEPFTDDARRIARAAAVLALPAGEELLAEVAGLAPSRAARALTRTLTAALLEEKAGDCYGFRHALATQAVYEQTPGPERTRLHLRAAQAREAAPEPRPLALLAHHFEEANRPDQWARYAEEAAEAAGAVGDHRAAARLLEQALRAPRLAPAARVRVALKLAAAALYSDHPEAVVGELQRILDDESMSTGERGELRYWISRLRCQTGDRGAWREEMERAAEELGQRPGPASRAMVNLAWPVYGEQPLERHLAWLDRAVQAAARTEDRAVRTAVLSQRASILLCVGDPKGWRAIRDIPREGGTPEEKLQLLRAQHSLAVMALGLGYHRRAEGFLAEVARLDGELDHASWGPWRETTQASLDWRSGRWEGLEARVRELAERTGGRAGISIVNEIVLGSLLLSQGRIEESEALWSSISERAEASGWMSSQVTASAWRARIRLARGDAAGARDAVARGLDVIRGKGIWCWGRELVPVAVKASLACGEQAEARDLAEELASGLRDRDAPAARAASCYCQGAVAQAAGGHAAAARLFARADTMWGELPSPYEAAQAREGRARCLLAAGDEHGAALLLGALEVFGDLRASWDAARVRGELKANGIAPPSHGRGGRRAYGDELSPREAEVAHLAGVGRKNREIAELLFLSPRTVEDHVAAALRKLGLESRRELAEIGEQTP